MKKLIKKFLFPVIVILATSISFLSAPSFAGDYKYEVEYKFQKGHSLSDTQKAHGKHHYTHKQAHKKHHYDQHQQRQRHENPHSRHYTHKQYDNKYHDYHAYKHHDYKHRYYHHSYGDHYHGDRLRFLLGLHLKNIDLYLSD